ncbi:MAG: FKBP-type peptidyl-prolyl cis-trans isomerase [Bacteroidales bacterium]|nr:FKBP-type peptidyl-prolyl cis-trans isomerase [Bacteroidales bacterium]
MKIKLPYILIGVLILFISSCKNPAFNGFEKLEDGTYMKFHRVNNQSDKPKIGDYVSVEVNQYYGDSLGFSTNKEYGRPMRYELMKPFFVGDIMAALLNMHVGDSATVAFVIDSLCLKTYGMKSLPEYFTQGMPVYVDIHLVEIITAEQMEIERMEEISNRKINDEKNLSAYFSKNNIVTSDGLIVLNINGKNKRLAVEGDILKVRFRLLSLENDTIIDLSDDEPVAVRCGDQALGIGFDEAMRLVPEGGNGSFVIPSSLAFDSVGFEDNIPPYTSLRLDVEMIDIMTINEYEEEQKLLRDIENAEAMKRLEEEPQRISEFVKNHDVRVEPTSSGLYYLEIQRGTGDLVENGDLVSIHYNLYNLDDKLIETSFGGDPLQFVYGNGEMVPGIEEAVSYMRKGGRATIIVPSRIAFGEVAIDDELPANSTVVFDIDLVDLQKVN